MNSSAIFIADSADFLTSSNGFELELILIQHSFVSGCLTITPAKSTFEAFRSSCWIMYNTPISVSVTEILISLGSELITSAFMYSEKALIADINHMNYSMAESKISEITLEKSKEEYSSDENIEINVQFSIEGGLRDAFNEANWTKAYNNNDVSMKLKYGVKLTSGGFRKKELGRTIDSYRKAAIFWTRNPKLVNPMKDRRIWVQVAKNFEPFIRLSEEEVREEFLDFNEKFVFKASDLGKGKHKIGAEVFSSWQKHDFTEPGNIKNNSNEIEVVIN